MESPLAAAVCAVMQQVRYIRQTGKNDFHRYRYASDDDLLTALQPAMAEVGLALMPVHVASATVEHTPDRKGKAQWRTDLIVTYRLVHASGESIELQAPGCGIDGEDKGAYKAMTGALKYVLRHTFLVPTGDDAERDKAQSPSPAPDWEGAREKAYLARLEPMGLNGQTGRITSFMISRGWPVARDMQPEQLERFLIWLEGPGRSEYDNFSADP